MKEKIELQNWSSRLLIIFSYWLWKEKEYGHALLCGHAPSLGMKVGEQVNIKWKDYIDEYNQVKYVLKYNDGKVKARQLSADFQDITAMAFKTLKIKDKNSYVYTNTKTGKVLTTSTLNRELLRFSKQFKIEVYNATGLFLLLKELKSNAFEIAWAMDMVKKYMMTKQVFSTVSQHMGHRTLSDTYEALGLVPNDEVELKFNMCNYKMDLNKLDTMFEKRSFKRLIDDTGLNYLTAETIKEKKIKIQV